MHVLAVPIVQNQHAVQMLQILLAAQTPAARDPAAK